METCTILSLYLQTKSSVQPSDWKGLTIQSLAQIMVAMKWAHHSHTFCQYYHPCLEHFMASHFFKVRAQTHNWLTGLCPIWACRQPHLITPASFSPIPAPLPFCLPLSLTGFHLPHGWPYKILPCLLKFLELNVLEASIFRQSQGFFLRETFLDLLELHSLIILYRALIWHGFVVFINVCLLY